MNNEPKSRPIQDEREQPPECRYFDEWFGLNGPNEHNALFKGDRSYMWTLLRNMCCRSFAAGEALGAVSAHPHVSPPAAQPEPLKHEPLEWGTNCPAAPDRGPHECVGDQACAEKHMCLRCGVPCLCPSCNHGEPRVRSSVSERWIHMRTDIGRAMCIDPPVDPAQPESQMDRGFKCPCCGHKNFKNDAALCDFCFLKRIQDSEHQCASSTPETDKNAAIASKSSRVAGGVGGEELLSDFIAAAKTAVDYMEEENCHTSAIQPLRDALAKAEVKK